MYVMYVKSFFNSTYLIMKFMKYIIPFLLTFFFFSTQLRAENLVEPQSSQSFMINPSIQSLANNDLSNFQDMAQYYKKKSKNMKIAGAVLTGAGAFGLALYGFARISVNKWADEPWNSGGIDAAFLVPSIACCFSGVGLLVYARKYKKQAISLQAGTQTAYEPCLQRMAQQPALGVRWSF